MISCNLLFFTSEKAIYILSPNNRYEMLKREKAIAIMNKHSKYYSNAQIDSMISLLDPLVDVLINDFSINSKVKK